MTYRLATIHPLKTTTDRQRETDRQTTRTVIDAVAVAPKYTTKHLFN